LSWSSRREIDLWSAPEVKAALADHGARDAPSCSTCAA
jgi:hypothetical protein